MKLKDIRREFQKGSLTRKSVRTSPFEQFNLWMDDAKNTDEILDPNAFAISSISENGRPHSRMVLLKEFSESGFVFFTNYESNKGMEIENNPYVSFLFYWEKLERQIRIEGKLERLSDVESDEYFNSRPYSSRIGAWASAQSRKINNRAELEKKVAKYIITYPLNPPRPEHWGGFNLVPDYFEFWQGRSSRIHDRIIYELNNSSWDISRLSP